MPRAAQLAFGAWYRSEPGEGAGAVRRLLARPEGAGVAGGHVQEQLATVAGALEALEAGGLLRHGAEALASPARGTGRAVGKWHWDFQPKRAPAGAGGAEEEAARAAQLQSLLEPAALGPAASGSEDEDGEGEAGPMEVEGGSSEEEATEVPAEVPGPAEAEGGTPRKRKPAPEPKAASTKKKPAQPVMDSSDATPAVDGLGSALPQPKRARTAYLIFSGEKQKELKAQNPSMAFGELSKAVGAQWKQLPAAQKAPYEEQAAADKERYKAEMEAFKAGKEWKEGAAGSTQRSEGVLETPVAEKGDSGVESEEAASPPKAEAEAGPKKEKKEKKEKKKKKDKKKKKSKDREKR